jgi:hypothetical protein
VTARARAYLHGNCSGCHRPNGEYPDRPDFRFTTSLAQSRTCEVEATHADFAGATVRLVPGAADESVLLRLMRSTAEFRMPLVGTTLVDPQGSALIESWIDSLDGCN